MQRRRYPPAQRRQIGLSVIELLIALALTGIVLSAATAMMLQAYTNEATYRQQNYVQQNARTALDMIADDMKQARCDAGNKTQVTVSGKTETMPTGTVRGTTAGNATPSNISSYTSPLYFNITNDAGTVRRVRYWLNGSDLRREVVTYVDETTTPGSATSATGGVVVARNLTTFTAQKPYDSQAISSPSQNNYNIVRVIIQTTISGQTTKLQADITLRNNLL